MSDQDRIHLIFDAPGGLRYNTAVHDYIEADGSLAGAERVAEVWGMTVEEVKRDRERAALRMEARRGPRL